MKTAQIGSISNSTLLIEDLIPAFLSALEELDHPIAKEFRRDLNDDANEEMLHRILVEMEDCLNDCAPPFCYFGAHTGDGSDFGFWPDMDALEEMPKISDPIEADKHGECVFVNDHGNVTFYRDGEIVFEFV